jgi:hypothetical protein
MKFIKILFPVFLLLLLEVSIFAQRVLNKGHLHYELIEVSIDENDLSEDANIEFGSLVGMLEGSTVDLYLKKENQRLDIDVTGFLHLQMFRDGTNKQVTLIDIFGNKMKSVDEIKDKEDESNNKFLSNIKERIHYIDGDARQIAGLTCKKMEIETDDKEAKVEAYYSEKYRMPDIVGLPKDFQIFRGIPMEIVISKADTRVVLRAISFEKKVSKKIFEIPDGYKSVDDEEIDEMFKGIKM